MKTSISQVKESAKTLGSRQDRSEEIISGFEDKVEYQKIQTVQREKNKKK